MASLDVGEKLQLKAGGRELQVSSLDKVLFPSSGFTKGGAINYYIRISEYLLPHLQDRPLTLKLYLNGVERPAQYVKNAPAHRPRWVRTAHVWRRSHDSKIQYVLVNDLPTLIWSVNHYNLEMHTFLARAPRIERPTMLVFDLDPGPPATILDCARVALRLKEVLEMLGLRSYVKASGSKGLHVAVPLNTPVTYDRTREFAAAAAANLQEGFPELVVTDMAKVARRGRVFVDYSQNVDFKSTASVYSLRARPDGPFISIPFEWREVASFLEKAEPARFFVQPEAAFQRVNKLGDLFAPVLKLKQELPVDAFFPGGAQGNKHTQSHSRDRRRTGRVRQHAERSPS